MLAASSGLGPEWAVSPVGAGPGPPDETAARHHGSERAHSEDLPAGGGNCQPTGCEASR